jgi:hypothetical protein
MNSSGGAAQSREIIGCSSALARPTHNIPHRQQHIPRLVFYCFRCFRPLVGHCMNSFFIVLSVSVMKHRDEPRKSVVKREMSTSIIVKTTHLIPVSEYLKVSKLQF